MPVGDASLAWGIGGFGRALGSLGVALVTGMALAAPAVAQRTDNGVGMPVVLELYTAQGCSACPPADQMLAALAPREDVIALGLHVDYWDYIGWADVFADPEYGERQKRYARRHGNSTIYTPQVIIDGVELIEGFRVMQIMDLIDRRRAAEREIELTLSRSEGEILEINATHNPELGPMIASRSSVRALGTMAGENDATAGERPHEVALVRYMPRAFIEITAGENAGLTTEYLNIVTSWETVTSWDPARPLNISVRAEGGEPVVVIVQEAGQGEILAAARLR